MGRRIPRLALPLGFAALAATAVLLALWLGRDGGRLRPERSSVAPPLVEASEAEPVIPEEASSPEITDHAPLSLERLLTVPEGFSSSVLNVGGTPVGQPPDAELSGSTTKASGLGPEWLDPSATVGSERTDALVPGVGVESRRVGVGATVSPGKKGETPGDVSVTVEGAVREDVYDEQPDLPQRDGSIGVRVNVPWPQTDRSEPHRERKGE